MARKPASPKPGARRGAGAKPAAPRSPAAKAPVDAKTSDAAPASSAAKVTAKPSATAAKSSGTATSKTAVAPKAAAKPKTPSRPRAKAANAAPKAPSKPRAEAGKATPKALTSTAKSALAAIPIPQVSARQAAVGAAATTGVLAAVGAAFFLWRASKADQPDYRVVEQDGDFEIREYPALVTAATEARGPREAALDRGFRTLADYIFAKSRSGDKIAMTTPVLSDTDGKGWRTRFIMPAGKTHADLPTPPGGVTISHEPRRRIAAVRFSGRADDAILSTREGALRSWLQIKSMPSESKAVHAYYNSPMMPGPFRRNEVLVTLSEG